MNYNAAMIYIRGLQPFLVQGPLGVPRDDEVALAAHTGWFCCKCMKKITNYSKYNGSDDNNSVQNSAKLRKQKLSWRKHVCFFFFCIHRWWVQINASINPKSCSFDFFSLQAHAECDVGAQRFLLQHQWLPGQPVNDNHHSGQRETVGQGELL